MTKIGFIGLGIMGSGMAANLLKNDVDLLIHNRTAKKGEPLVASGAAWAETPADLSEVDILFTMLAHPEAVTAVSQGDDGFLPHLKPNALWVDCSTVHPSFSRKTAVAAAQHNVRFLDAPVAGSKGAAEAGTLAFLAGGSANDLAEAQPFMELMGQRVVHVGEQGMGISLKVVVNMILASTMATFAEGLVLGQQLGLAKETLLNVLVGGPVAPPYWAAKRDNIASDSFAVEFPLKWMQKDLQMVTQAAYEVGSPMPVANVAKEIYQLATRAGLGELDFSAVYQYLNQP